MVVCVVVRASLTPLRVTPTTAQAVWWRPSRAQLLDAVRHNGGLLEVYVRTDVVSPGTCEMGDVTPCCLKHCSILLQGCVLWNAEWVKGGIQHWGSASRTCQANDDQTDDDFP